MVDQLSRYRQSIDNIDAALVYMLAERFKVTKAVGELKARHMKSAPPLAKVAYDPGLSIEGLAAAIDETEVAIRAAVPTARLIYIEPGLVELKGEPGGTAEPAR